jgi:O-antigen ligase
VVPPRPSAIAAVLNREPQPVRLARIETWDWGWGGLLLFTIFLFFRPQDQIPGMHHVHIAEMAAILGLTAMTFINLSRRRPITRVTPELVGVFALGGVILATAPTSFWPGGAVGVFTTLVTPVMFVFMLMVNCVTSPRRVERICWVIVLAFGYMCLWVILNYLRGTNMVEGDRVQGPVGGFFENPNDLALNMASFLPLALMYVKRPGPVFKRLLCAGIAVLMLTVMVLTKSRGGMLGTVAMLATFLLVSRSLTPGMMIALVFSGMLVLPALPQSFWSRMASITDAEKDPTGSRAERKELLKLGWEVFLEYPITGVGAGQFQNMDIPGQPKRWRETHNALLQVASELGIFGVIAFKFLIVRGFAAASWTRRHLAWIYRKRSRKRTVDPEEDGLDQHEREFLQTHGAAMVAAMVGWFVCAFFASVAYNWTFYYVLGLSVTARDIVRARARAYARAKAQAQGKRVAA